ncbi:MAG TPA: flagellar hook-associated protein FlgK [Thermoleophilaceae bacterium]|jgi:flagellar hook-associated protein 1 FlgK
MAGVSTFFGLETTLRGLLAQQGALDVTSHNIANANTPGYSRQQAVLSASDPLQVTDGTRLSTLASLGTGVDIQSYQRIRDQFLDLQYRAQNMVLGQQSATSDALSNVETALQEPGTNGISAQLAKFWSAWSDVANNPDGASSTAGKQALVDQANTLVESLHSLDSQLTAASQDAGNEYTSLTAPGGQVDQDVREIANLNKAIKASVAAGDKPNDLMDKRDQLLDDLSGLGQVSVADNGDGSITLNFGDAANPVVDGSSNVDWPQTLNNAGPPPTSPGGKLGALYDIFKSGGTVDSLRSDLNGVASNLASTVNAIHNRGGATGTDFFSVGAAGTEASTIAVNVNAQTVVTDSGGPALGDVAAQIAALRGGTADSAYSTFVTRIGSMVQNAQRQQSTAQALVNAADSSRQSTSGVSMDEEMTNMIKFQRAYQASARAMTTMDQLLDTLINRTGSAGL